MAFLVALQQNGELLGKNGLLPVHLYLNRLREHFKVTLYKHNNNCVLAMSELD